MQKWLTSELFSVSCNAFRRSFNIDSLLVLLVSDSAMREHKQHNSNSYREKLKRNSAKDKTQQLYKDNCATHSVPHISCCAHF